MKPEIPLEQLSVLNYFLERVERKEKMDVRNGVLCLAFLYAIMSYQVRIDQIEEMLRGFFKGSTLHQPFRHILELLHNNKVLIWSKDHSGFILEAGLQEAAIVSAPILLSKSAKELQELALKIATAAEAEYQSYLARKTEAQRATLPNSLLTNPASNG